MEQIKQVQQLKINVNNINSVLKASNKEYNKLKKENSVLLYRKLQREKKELKEKKIESKNKFRFGLRTAKDIVTSQVGNIFDKILGFSSFILGGILVNALPGIIKKTKEIFDSIVDFVTPIQSGFNLIKGFFEGDLDKSKYDVDKKRVDDALENIKGDGGLIDQLAEKAGPLEGFIKTLKPAIELIRGAVGGKKIELHKKGGKEGFLNTETGQFTEKQFTSAERKRYESGNVTVDKSTVKASKFLDDPKGISGSQLVVTSEMGNRDFALSPGMHMGVDIAGPEGTPLVAFSKGTLTDKGYDGGYGNYVVWTDDNGIEHFYGHLKNMSNVKVGSSLSRGQVIGLMGNTGRSSGPHLHWETSTIIGDTGRSKGAVLSRFNPLSRYGKNDPFKIEKIENSKESSTGKSKDSKGGGLITPKPRDKNNQASVLNTTMGGEGTTTIMVLRQPVIVG